MARRSLVLLTCVLLAACGGGSSSDDASTPSNPDVVYVALGDSWPHGAHCGMCRTFAARYSDGIAEITGAEVEFLDRTTNGGTTADLLEQMRGSGRLRADLARADVVMISTGLNDLEDTGAIEDVVAGTCGGADDLRCLRRMGRHWDERFTAILDELDAAAGDRPMAVRLVTGQNIFLSDPSVLEDLGLPPSFARGGGEVLTRELTEAQCDLPPGRSAVCVDVWTLFNGEQHDQVVDENSPQAMQRVADALTATGLPELGHGDDPRSAPRRPGGRPPEDFQGADMG